MYTEHYASGEPGDEPVEWWMVWPVRMVATLSARHVKRPAEPAGAIYPFPAP